MEIFEQFIGTKEFVEVFHAVYMTMITFSCLVVIAQYADFVHHIGQPVFESMAAADYSRKSYQSTSSANLLSAKTIRL